MHYLHLKEWEQWDKGYVTHRIEAHDEGNPIDDQGPGDWTSTEIAYITVNYMPSAVWEERYSGKVGFLRFAKKFMGWEFNEPIVIPQAIAEIAEKIGRDDTPDVQAMERSELFDAFEEHMTKAIEEFGEKREQVARYVDKPKIDYVQVAEGHREEGIGTQIYEEAARWLGEEFGLDLYSSELRSDPAEAVWESFTEDGKAEYVDGIDRYRFIR